MSIEPVGARSLLPLRKLLRRHPAARLPDRSALSDLPESVDLDVAKAALEQVNKRLESQLTLKGTTETRAITLAGQCTTLLSAITAALLVEASSAHRITLLVAASVASICLFSAVIFAYNSANPKKISFLPGRLPDELWDDLTAPGMTGSEFMGRLILGLQDVMALNERNQECRARALSRAIIIVRATVPLTLIAAAVTRASSNYHSQWVVDITNILENQIK